MSTPRWPKVNPKQNFPAQELEVLKYWESEKIFEESVAREPKKGEFVFYDGPPFATGLPHYGHILQSVIKDLVPRYQTMRGHRVERKWGWDCHGLPVENLIEKELGLADKKAVEAYGIGNFNEACRASVLRYADEWRRFIPRMGRWVDMTNDYKTMDPAYMESVWWVFKQLWDKELIYAGFKSMHICPRCVTPLSISEVGLGYKDATDLSAIAKFKMVGEENTYFLAWTTTPWTLPGNVALAVNPEVEYVKVRDKKTNYFYILAKERMSAVGITTAAPLPKNNQIQESGEWQVSDKDVTEDFENEGWDIEGATTVKGSELVGLSYEPLFDFFASEKEKHPNAFTVRAADFVTTTDGTGIVHIAPAFGEDDLNLGKRDNLPLVQHVTMDGHFVPVIATSEMAFGKLPIKHGKTLNEPDKVDVEIVKWLDEHEQLFDQKRERHSYPHCWRCETALLNYATSSWFVAVEKIKDDLLKNNEKVNWVPGHVKAGRFGKWLEGARDWAISRNRYWGAPLPVWRCDTTDETVCVGSIDELEKLSGVRVDDLHKHFVDDVTWANEKAADQAVEITFLRHGETDWNATKRWQGQIDIPLNDTGRAQAMECRGAVNADDYDVIISSDLSRAHETAQIVAEGREITTDARLREKGFGVWEGKTTAEIQAMHPDLVDGGDDSIRLATAPDGESVAELRTRVSAAIVDIKRRYAGKRVLVVCHALALKMARLLTTDNQNFVEALPNCYRFSTRLTPTFHRIPEVLDCWFESGSMPYAQTAARGATKLPANFIAEAQDQTRGWFYTLHVLATALQDKPAFENVICSGLVLAEDGQKMSKSKKNYPDPSEIIDEFGADAMRLYLMSSPIVQGEELRFSRRGVEETLRGVLLPLWNTYYFFTTYAIADGWDGGELPAEPTNKLDRWILSELNILIREMTAKLDEYKLNEAVKPLAAFLDGLTNWYVRRSRRRFWKSDSDTDKEQAYATLLHVLTTVSKLLAPVSPFIAETVYRGLTNDRSVHLADWPEVDASRIDEALSREVDVTRNIISLGLALRARENIKVRQPLQSVSIALPDYLPLPTIDIFEKNDGSEVATIKEELNVKEVKFRRILQEFADQVVSVNARACGPRLGKKVQQIIAAAKAGNFEIKDDGVLIDGEVLTGDEVAVGYHGKAGLAVESSDGIVVALDTTITPELGREGRARDLIRVVQELRKKADFDVSDRIKLSVHGADEILADDALKTYIATETLATFVEKIENPSLSEDVDGLTIAVKKA